MLLPVEIVLLFSHFIRDFFTAMQPRHRLPTKIRAPFHLIHIGLMASSAFARFSFAFTPLRLPDDAAPDYATASLSPSPLTHAAQLRHRLVRRGIISFTLMRR